MISFSSQKVDLSNIKKKSQQALLQAQRQLDNDVLKDSNFYVPNDLGNLEASGILHSKLGDGEITWQTPYARRLYYNPEYNFSKDKNPNAQGLWFEAAKSANRDKWVEDAKKYYKHFFDRG